MAEAGRRRVLRAEVALGAVVVGAVTGAITLPPMAVAEDYPSWQDVQKAKSDATAANAEVAHITDLLVGLQEKADAAGRVAQIAAERFHRAKAVEDAARARRADLAAQAAAARRTAKTSRMRAGLLASHLARTGGGELSLDLALSGERANGLLYQLATMSQLSAQTQQIYRRAVADERAATALEEQAAVATHELGRRTKEADEALTAARAASSAAAAAVETQRANVDRLTAQLAELRHTSKRVTAQYIAGVQERRAAAKAALDAARASAAPKSQAPVAPSNGSPSGSGPSGGSASGSSGTSASPASSAPSDSGSSTAPQPSSGPGSPGGAGSSNGSGSSGGSGSSNGSGSSSGSGSGSSSGSGASSGGSVSPPATHSAPPPATHSAPPPNSARAASAVAYARDQIGERYGFGGAGPTVWDCSGLTMKAYSSIGIGIGGHGATVQYDTARAQGQLVPYSQAAVGDLVFYTDGGGDMYHVAIYSGSGMMIEAPYDGVPVREVPVRSYQRLSVVARPTA